MDDTNTPESLHQSAQAAQTAPPLTPERQAQLDETARQLATATAIPGVSTEMLDTGKEMLSAGVDVLGTVADVAGVALAVVEVAGSVIGAVADALGSLDVGS